MSESEHESTGVQAIEDEQLPEDLQPEENPLAGGLDAGETVDDLMTGGKQAEESGSDGSQEGDDGAS
jgi:hypothetical protein